MRRAAFLFAGLVIAQPCAGQDIGATEDEIENLRQRIEAVRARREADLRQRDSALAALRDAETEEAQAARSLGTVRGRLADAQSRLSDIEGQIAGQEAGIADELDRIDDQLRIAWLSGREEWLKLVLSLEDPAELGRQLVYQAYLVRSRSESVDSLRQGLTRLAALQGELEAERENLRSLAVSREAALARTRAARADRDGALEALTSRLDDSGSEIRQLTQQVAELETLLAELVAAVSGVGDTAFGEALGRLEMPAAGRITARYGAPRAGGQLRWQGTLIEAAAGSPVASVHEGQVIFAGWLPGMGLLAVIDHGRGYLTLYAHNESLLCEVGERVEAGQIIGSVGDSGGRPVPALYFEVRKDGAPVDPKTFANSR